MEESSAIPQRRLVLIEWEDSYGCSSRWGTIPPGDETPKVSPAIVRSVGWLWIDTPKVKVLIPHVADVPETPGEEPHQDGCGDMTIPTRSIVRIVDLVERPAPRRGKRRETRETSQ